MNEPNNEQASLRFLSMLVSENEQNREVILRRFREGSHGINPFTGKEIRLVEVELRDSLEQAGVLDDDAFQELFSRFVDSIINSVTWGLLMSHDKAGEDEDHRYCLREHDGADLVPYLHELWSQVKNR